MDLLLLHIKSLNRYGSVFYFILHTCMCVSAKCWFLMDAPLALEGYDYYVKM